MSDLSNLFKKAKYIKHIDDNKLTMVELSKISGIKLNTLNGIFFNEKIPKAEILLCLGKALNIKPLDILKAAKKITKKMEMEVCTREELLKSVYQNTYWIDADQFPEEIDQHQPHENKNES